MDDRAALTGILFVLRSGVPWERLPAKMNCGCGTSCWHRLRDWQAAGLWRRLHQVLLECLHAAGEIDWSRASLDSARIGEKWGSVTGPDPTDRGEAGTKRHLVTDARSTPLGLDLTGANCHDSPLMAPTLAAIPPLRSGRRGRPRRRPDKVHADKAYDAKLRRQECRARGITSRIARRGIERSDRLGRHRWVVERSHAWLTRARRLPIRS